MVNSNENLNTTFAALFKDLVNAEKAYNFAIQKEYKKEDINILMSEEKLREKIMLLKLEIKQGWL